jgi:hypothetical protein
MNNYSVKGTIRHIYDSEKADMKVGYPLIEAESEVDAAAQAQFLLGQDVSLSGIKVRQHTDAEMVAFRLNPEEL